MTIETRTWHQQNSKFHGLLSLIPILSFLILVIYYTIQSEEKLLLLLIGVVVLFIHINQFKWIEFYAVPLLIIWLVIHTHVFNDVNKPVGAKPGFEDQTCQFNVYDVCIGSDYWLGQMQTLRITHQIVMVYLSITSSIWIIKTALKMLYDKPELKNPFGKTQETIHPSIHVTQEERITPKWVIRRGIAISYIVVLLFIIVGWGALCDFKWEVGIVAALFMLLTIPFYWSLWKKTYTTTRTNLMNYYDDETGRYLGHRLF